MTYSMIELSCVLELESVHFLHYGFFEVDVRLVYVLGEICYTLLLLVGALGLE